MGRSDRTETNRETSLLELVSAVAEHAADDREVAQIVGHLINQHRFVMVPAAGSAPEIGEYGGRLSALH